MSFYYINDNLLYKNLYLIKWLWRLHQTTENKRYSLGSFVSVNCPALERAFILLRDRKNENYGRTVVTYSPPFQTLQRRRNVFPSLIYWTVEVKACERAKLLWRMLDRELNLLHCPTYAVALRQCYRKSNLLNTLPYIHKCKNTLIREKIRSRIYQKCFSRCIVIVYYVPRHIMRVIARRSTMLAGDRRWGVAEEKPRRSRGAISPTSILSESRNYPNCVHWHIFYFMWLRCVYEFLCVHSNLI